MALNDTSNLDTFYFLEVPVSNGGYPFSPTEDIISSTSDMIFPESLMNDLYLEIDIQPVEKFRFRYKSEAGSHGGIAGEGHCKPKKAYPTVKLQNPTNLYSDRKIFIKVSLYTSDDNPRPHVLELVGKICKDGVGYQKLDSKTSSAKFQGISILNKTKHEILEILKERKKLELNVLSLNKDQEEETQEELKNLNLNAVRLCFEAVFEDTMEPVPGCSKILSSIIFNLKSTFTGDLKICRLSRCTGKTTGDEDTILLCNKIKKDEIQIKFFEKDEQENILWATTAKFNPLDVHHQVAIPFKTPRYEGTLLDCLEDGDQANVWIQLFRKSDEKHGEPVPFTYICDKVGNSKKRKWISSIESLPSSSFQLDANLIPTIPVDYANLEYLQSCKGLFDDIGDIFEANDDTDVSSPDVVKMDAVDANAGIATSQQYSQRETFEYQSHDFWQLQRLQMNVGTESQAIDKDSMIYASHTSSRPEKSLSFTDTLKNIISMFSPGPTVTCAGMNNTKGASGAINKDTNLQMKHTNASIALENSLNSMSLNDSDNVTKIGIGNGTEQTKMGKFSFSVKNLLKNKNISYYSSESVTIQDSSGNSLLHLAIMEKNPDVIYGILEFIKENLVNHKNLKKETPLHLAIYGNHTKVLKLLLNHGGNPYICNKDGNNCFHLAAIYNFTECMRELLNSLSNDEEKNCSPSINTLNFDGLAPIHLSIIHNSKECMKLLLNANADVNIVENKSGKSPFHLAVDLRSPFVIDLLSQLDIDIDLEDYRGFTALQNACEAHDVSYEGLSSELKIDKEQIALMLMKLFEKEDSSESSSEDGTENETSDDDEDFEEKVENFLNSNKIWMKLGPIVNADIESLEILGRMDKNPARTLIKKIKELNFGTEETSGSSKKTLLCILEMVGLDDAVKHL